MVIFVIKHLYSAT